jgi:hypothetical protein
MENKMADTIVVARVGFTYTKWRDRGEVFKLTSARNDNALIGLRYVLPFSPTDHKQILCDKCGRKFSTELYFEGHKRKVNCEDELEITKLEFADLIGADPEKVVMEV